MKVKKSIVFGPPTLAIVSFSGCDKELPVKEENISVAEIERMNIVCILVDDVGFDKIGCYSGNNLTPNIDRLAEDGVIYGNAYTCSAICTPSRYSLLTSNYPGRSKDSVFVKTFPDKVPYCIDWNSFLSEDDHTIFEALNENGFHTGFVGKYHLSSDAELKKCLPVCDPETEPEKAESFLKVHQDSLVSLIKRKTGAEVVDNVTIGNCEINPINKLKTHHVEWTTYGACDFIEKAPSDKPFFLFVASNLTHGPGIMEGFRNDPVFTPEGKVPDVMKYSSTRQQVKDQMLFKANAEDENMLAVVLLDNQVGDIIRTLKENGLYKNSLIIFVSDNNNEPGKGSCYESGVHVPMIIKWPGNKDAGIRDRRMIQNIDLFPTILSLCKIDYNKKNIDGISFYKNDEERKEMYFEAGYTRGIRSGKYKYICFRYPENIKSGFLNGSLEKIPNHLASEGAKQAWFSVSCYPGYWNQDQLYDIENDPFEMRNLAGEKKYDKTVREMKNKLAVYLNTFRNVFSIELDTFMESEQYKKAVEKSMKTLSGKIGPENIRFFNGRHLLLKR